MSDVAPHGDDATAPPDQTWQARFITAGDHDGSPGSPAPYLRTEFTVADGLAAATLHLTALGLIEAHLNGAVIGDEVLVPGWTSYRHRLLVSTHDVTELVTAGANALGAIVGEGWAVGRLGWDGRRQFWADRPAAFMQLELDYGDRTDIVATDTTWRAGTGGVRANSLYDGETYDARAEPSGWDAAGFDDSAWGAVDVVDRDLTTLVASTVPPIRRIETLAARDVFTTPAGRTVVDFGQNLTGWVRLTARGDPGTTITLRHCETLIDGEPEFETNRGALATDRFTLSGSGPETFEPRFTFHGFRYVDIDGWPGEPTPDALTAVVVHTDLRRTGWFTCSDELLNSLHDNIVWSMRGNFVGIPTDCPQRDERLGWTGDINAFAPTATFLYDVTATLGSWLADLAAEQAATGGVPSVVPDILGEPPMPTALWGDVAVNLPVCLYEATGDRSILEAQYASMTAYVDSVIPRLDDRGVWNTGFQFGDWVDPDAPPDKPGAGKADRYLVATAYFARTTRQLAEVAALLGHDADAMNYASLHARVRAAFRDEWVTPAGLVADASPTASALAICFGLLDESQEARAGQQLARLVARAGHRIATGFAGTPWVDEALTRTGHLDTAYELLTQTGCPSFLYPVTMGATTVWERWDAIRPDGTLNRTGMTSLNHYALGAVATWLHRTVAGLAPAEAGYERLAVEPRPGGGLTHAAAEHDTPHGRARVAWHIGDDARFTLEATVPAGTTARVVLPRHPEGHIDEVGPGDHAWSYAWAGDDAIDPASPVRGLRLRTELWAALDAAVLRHVGVELDTLDQLLDASLTETLAFADAAYPELAADLHAILDPLVDRDPT